MTSQEALYSREQPESLVILGGGYIAVELGYFFESLGTDVKIVEMMDSLVPREDRMSRGRSLKSPSSATRCTLAIERPPSEHREIL